LRDVVPIEAVVFCDPRDNAADAFGIHMRELGVETRRVSDARTAARGADVVVTVTTSTRPVLELADVEPGTFVAGVGADNPSKHELATDLLQASRVIVDSVAQAAAMGDLHHAIEAGVMRATDVQGELAELVAGRLAGRMSDGERWVFDSTGLAIQDLAAAGMIYERARAAGGVPQILLGN
jgi:ornithine cyclodeaminase/alanine dehydrogenase-like protein (mu-crystallin family)